MKIIAKYTDGSRRIQVSEGVEISLNPRNHVTGGTDGGWDWVMKTGNPDIAHRGVNVGGDSTGWPGINDDIWTFTGTV